MRCQKLIFLDQINYISILNSPFTSLYFSCPPLLYLILNITIVLVLPLGEVHLQPVLLVLILQETRPVWSILNLDSKILTLVFIVDDNFT